MTEWRVNTFTKEPETLEWIETFDKTKLFYFGTLVKHRVVFDICATIHSNCKIVSFEPSSNNLRILTRNISINSLEDRISVFRTHYPIRMKSF